MLRPDLRRTVEHELSPLVREAVGVSNVNLPGGSLRGRDSHFIIRTLNEFDTVDEIGSVIVAERDGAAVRLRDVAKVSMGAKEREELFLPGRSEPIVLPATSSALYLVQRLRDEAHRFAITYHRTLRDRRTVKSAFDDLPGVGPKRKRELLKVFGSLKRVREAPVEQIAAVPGISRALAERIKATLEA